MQNSSEIQPDHGMIGSMGYFVCEDVGHGDQYADPEVSIDVDGPMTKSDEDNIYVARMQEIQQMEKFGLGEFVKNNDLDVYKIPKARWVDNPGSVGSWK